MNLLQRYVSHGIAIGLLVFIMLAFNLSVLAQKNVYLGLPFRR